MIDLPPPSYAQTIEAIAKCDIPRANIRIKYEDYLQSDEVTISDLGQVTDGKFRCLRAAVHPFYILTLQNGAQQAAFYDLSERDDRPRQLAQAREWARKRGMLDRVPTFDPERGITEFSAALDTVCGFTRGSALQAKGASWVTVRPDFISKNDFEKSSNALECLMQMFAASNAPENGIKFGFIGNEAYTEDKK